MYYLSKKNFFLQSKDIQAPIEISDVDVDPAADGSMSTRERVKKRWNKFKRVTKVCTLIWAIYIEITFVCLFIDLFKVDS